MVWDRFKLHIPMGIGQIVRKLAVARFSRTLGTLITSGVPILQAIEITGQAAGNAVIEKAMKEVQVSVKEGQSITAPLEKESVFRAHYDKGMRKDDFWDAAFEDAALDAHIAAKMWAPVYRPYRRKVR